jgi:hypothetical protein
VLRQDASLACAIIAAMCTCGIITLGHRFALRALHRAIHARGGSIPESLDAQFFRSWLYGETSLLVFLYAVTYTGAVTACLKPMVLLAAGEWWVPASLLGGSTLACGMFLVTLKRNNFDFDEYLWDPREDVVNFAMNVAGGCLIVGSLLSCLVWSASDTLVIVSFLFAPWYTVIPVVLLGLAAQGARDHCLEQAHTENPSAHEWKVAVLATKLGVESNDENEDKVEAAAFLTIIQSYEPRYW